MQPNAWDSSLLKAAAYPNHSAVLQLVFHNGAVYCYFGVALQTYHQLLRAESKGGYFNSHIRNRFNFTKLLTAVTLHN